MSPISTKSKECIICHYWFFNHRFESQDSVCNGCHDLTMLSVNISNIAIISVKNVDYHCIIHNICKSEAINLLKKILFLKIVGIYKKCCLKPQSIQGNFSYFVILLYIKWLIVWTSGSP